MKKLLISFSLICFLANCYFLHRLWVFAPKVSHSLEYLYAGVDCLLMEDGRAQENITRLSQRQSPIKGQIYDDDIPECHAFFSRYRCWELNPRDPLSLDGCGKRFGLNQEEIDTMKADPSTINAVMDANWARLKAKTK